MLASQFHGGQDPGNKISKTLIMSDIENSKSVLCSFFLTLYREQIKEMVMFC